jgi:surface protein
MGLYIAISNSIGASSISGGAGKPTFEFTINTANLSTGSTANNQFKLPLTSSTGLNCKVSWGDGTTSDITSHTAPAVTHTYPNIGTYTIKITGSLLGWQFNNTGDRLKMLDVIKWAGLNISVPSGFNGCTNLTATAIDAPLITTGDLSNYFNGCTNFNGSIGNWNVSNVTNMNAMFVFASNFNQPIGSWNVSNVGIFQNTFFGTTIFNQDLSMWDVSKASNMTGMFRNSGFNQPIGSWNVSNVTIMAQMFSFANAFNQNIGSWNISKVSNIQLFMDGKTAANYSAVNLDSIYNGWSSRPVKPNLSITFGSIKYTAAGQAGKDILLGAPNLWIISDGGI